MSWRVDRSGSGAALRPCRFSFPNTDHVTISRFESLSCLSKRLRASREISNFERKYSPVYCHMICITKTELTSAKGLLIECLTKTLDTNDLVIEGTVNLQRNKNYQLNTLQKKRMRLSIE